jgi:8-oxo-dGTP diphosphatase
VAVTAGITRVAAYALCNDGLGRVLLCRLAASELDVGLWTLPGGGVEFGERPGDACLRELREETGLEGAITSIAGIDSELLPPNSARGIPLHAIRILYRVTVTGGTLRDEPDGSTDRCAWVPPGDLPGLPVVTLVGVGLALLDATTA